MKAAVLYQANQPLEVGEVELDPPRRGEVLVRIAAAGICRSDYHYMKGEARMELPAVLGHEGSAVVEAVGEGVTRVRPGDHVILSFAPHCGQCFYCLRGRGNLCEVSMVQTGGKMFDGTTRLHLGSTRITHMGKVACFAEQAVVPETGCIPIPRELPLDSAALIGCCVTTGVGAVINTARIEPGSTVAVVGCGGVGVNVIQGAHLSNAARIIAVDPLEGKLEFAMKFGATDSVNPTSADPVAAVKALTGGRGVDYAFEVFGSSETVRVAFDMTRRGGTTVVVGLAPLGDAAPIDASALVRQEKTLKGSYYGSSVPAVDMLRMVQMYRAGVLKIDDQVTRRYSLDQINRAYADLERGEPGRGVITFG
ncbi:MAG: Zn-dependent alcohol dehydrogenase [Chloroflexi bacterium]|nr:Zn-dependent alcohol dehydrogenase [Chloroflexota bacterium]